MKAFVKRNLGFIYICALPVGAFLGALAQVFSK